MRLADELGYASVDRMLSEISPAEWRERKVWRQMNNEVAYRQQGKPPLSYEQAWGAVFTSKKLPSPAP